MKFLEEFTPRPAVAYLCVIGATILWAASTVIGRGVHEEIPPFGLTFWRWLLAALVLAPLVWRDLATKWPSIVANLKLIALLGVLQVGSSAVLLLAVNFTTAINASLLTAAQPALTVIPAWILTRDRVTAGQGLGIAAAFFGILVMVGRGDMQALAALQFNIGDILTLVAIVGWAFYATLVHRVASEIGHMTMLFFISLIGSLSVLPFYIFEAAVFRPILFNGMTIVTVIGLGVIVSLGSLILWNAALRAVGPNRATIFLNLVPVFGVAMAIVFLGERLFLFHIIGAALVALGIVFVVLNARRARKAE